jgi:hypothetical protein
VHSLCRTTRREPPAKATLVHGAVCFGSVGPLANCPGTVYGTRVLPAATCARRYRVRSGYKMLSAEASPIPQIEISDWCSCFTGLVSTHATFRNRMGRTRPELASLPTEAEGDHWPFLMTSCSSTAPSGPTSLQPCPAQVLTPQAPSFHHLCTALPIRTGDLTRAYSYITPRIQSPGLERSRTLRFRPFCLVKIEDKREENCSISLARFTAHSVRTVGLSSFSHCQTLYTSPMHKSYIVHITPPLPPGPR